MLNVISKKKLSEAIDYEIKAYTCQMMAKQMTKAPDIELLCLNERIKALELFKQHINPNKRKGEAK